VIRLEHATASLGGEEIFSDADVHVLAGDKIGVVGRNGSGKTTLLRVLAGELPLDEGRIERRSRVRVGTLPQHVVASSARSVWDEARSGMTRLLDAAHALATAEAALEGGGDDAIHRYEDARAAFELAGGKQADELIGRVLSGLGFRTSDWSRPCKELSGGWQMRVALARLLLSEPDIALLDEPTNHLDLLARSWLCDYLAEVRFSVVVVSHDRHLLETAINRVIELRGGRVHSYKGAYKEFLVQREERLQRLRESADAVAEEKARLQRFVERFGAKATKASQARSRKKMLERLEDVQIERLEAKPHFRLPPPPDGYREVLAVRDLRLGWTEDTAVLQDVGFTLQRGERLALVGRNGSGKSTLFAAVAGRLRPQAGTIVRGEGFRLGEFRQDLVTSLPGSEPALDYLRNQVPGVRPERIRAVIGALGLRGDDVMRPIGELSGGERARVALTLLAVRPANVLLLDEPTNHLDLESVEVLADALRNWEGALLFTAHDRWFVEQIATHVGRIDGGTIDVHPGVRPDDFVFDDRIERVARERSEQAVARDERRRQQKEDARLAKAIEKVAAEIARAEAELHTTDEALVAAATDHEEARRLATVREEVEARVHALYTKWEELEREAARLRASPATG
jgi:ATP-binding cassette subfamily F protein 3